MSETPQEHRQRDGYFPPECECGFPWPCLVAGQSLMQDDLAALLRALSLGDHARPETPHVVMQSAIAEVVRVEAERDALRAEVEEVRRCFNLEQAAANTARDRVASLESQVGAARKVFGDISFGSLAADCTMVLNRAEKAEAALRVLISTVVRLATKLYLSGQERHWSQDIVGDLARARTALELRAPECPGPHDSAQRHEQPREESKPCDGTDAGLGCDCGHAERHAPPSGVTVQCSRCVKLEHVLTQIQRRAERHAAGGDKIHRDNLSMDQMLEDLIWISGRVTEVLAE